MDFSFRQSTADRLKMAGYTTGCYPMGRDWNRTAPDADTAPAPYPTGDFPLRQTELQPGRYPGNEVPQVEELSRAGDCRGLLCRNLSGTADEAAHLGRKVACHLAAILRHSALPLLRLGRRNSAPSLRQHLPAAPRISSGCATGAGSHLVSLRNSGESPVIQSLTLESPLAMLDSWQSNI